MSKHSFFEDIEYAFNTEGRRPSKMASRPLEFESFSDNSDLEYFGMTPKKKSILRIFWFF